MAVDGAETAPPPITTAPVAGAGPGDGATWAVRLLAALCAAAGLYAVSASLIHIRRVADTGTWLLPLATGALTAVLGICIACAAIDSRIPWRLLGPRVTAIALLAAYGFVLLPLLGFLTASVLLVLVVTVLYASNRVLVGAGGLLIAVGMWALFAYVLAEPLPSGLWWQ
jgi:hypothetical protein